MAFIIVSCALVSLAVGPFFPRFGASPGVRDEDLCIIPDTIDQLLIALQTSTDARLDSIKNTPSNMYTHVINSGSPTADPSAAERSAEYEKPFWRRHPRKDMNDVGAIYAS